MRLCEKGLAVTKDWIYAKELSAFFGCDTQAFCLKEGGQACLNFVRHECNVKKLFCDGSAFEKAAADGASIVMSDGHGLSMTIYPQGYRDFETRLKVAETSWLTSIQQK